MKSILVLIFIFVCKSIVFSQTFDIYIPQGNIYIVFNFFDSILDDKVKEKIKKMDVDELIRKGVKLEGLDSASRYKAWLFNYYTNYLVNIEDKRYLYGFGYFGDAFYGVIDEAYRLGYWHYLNGMERNKVYLITFRYARKDSARSKQLYKYTHIADTLNGVYIPKDLDDCFAHINDILTKEEIERIVKYETDTNCFWSEYDLTAKKMRDKWQLLINSRLSHILWDCCEISNDYTVSGIIVIYIRKKFLNEEFDIQKFVKKNGLWNWLGRYKKGEEIPKM